MTAGRQRGKRDTAERILDVAERLVQIRGFNGFSYADVAAELGITTATLHYHYAGKAELGEALIRRYARRFGEGLAAIAARPSDASVKLEAYATLYGSVLQAERMCLCGMLAAEYATLPKPMRSAVTLFFDDNESWLERVLVEGQKDGSVHFGGTPRDGARMIVSGLEGAMLIARSYGDSQRFEVTAHRMLEAMTSDGAAKRRKPRVAKHGSSARPARS